MLPRPTDGVYYSMMTTKKHPKRPGPGRPRSTTAGRANGHISVRLTDGQREWVEAFMRDDASPQASFSATLRWLIDRGIQAAEADRAS
jgi:hypothetical protein